jgi:hypothetical protein
MLVVGQREQLSFALQVGDVHQTVEVPANPSVVVITTEDISGLVSERQVKDLPLNGRSYDQLNLEAVIYSRESHELPCLRK